MPVESSRSQINSLTATRAIAAIMVFIHHFGRAVFPFNRCPSVFTSGNIAVGYFFILSGFVLYIAHYNKVIGFGDFFRKRAARIVPVYEAALLLTILFAVHFSNYDVHSLQHIKEMGFSAFFVQSFIPSFPLVLNGPGWTISVEMFFYLLFPFLLVLQKKSTWLFGSITLTLFILSQYFHLKYFPQRHSLPDNIVDTVFFNPAIHLSQFLTGMMGGYVFTKIRETAPRLKYLPLAIFAVIIALLAYRPEKVSYHVGLIAPLFLLLILSIAVNNTKTLNFRPLVYLGEISYGIYILQQPIYSFLDILNQRHLHLAPLYFFWFALGVLILIASVSYHLMELPLKKRINAFGVKRNIKLGQ
jgi:peptidoglycan/LPS O-acetylase OafA/YrhL